MGLLKGRHAQIMSAKGLLKAREKTGLPDLYVRSAELHVDFDDPSYTALMDLSTSLSADERRRIEIEEGIRSS